MLNSQCSLLETRCFPLKEKPPGNWGLTLKQKPTIAHFHEPHFKCIFSPLSQKYSGILYLKVTFISPGSDMRQSFFLTVFYPRWPLLVFFENKR
jgi:hypothetical protein